MTLKRSTAYSRKYRKLHPEKYRALLDKWSARARERYAADPQRRKAAQERKKKWLLANPKKYAEVKRNAIKRWRNKYHNDPEFRARELARMKDWRQAHPEYHKTIWLKYQYGITEAEWSAILQSQGGGCAICGRTKSVSGQSTWTLDIDHCHNSGKVRGILCGPCNRGVGLFNDDPLLLEKAASYLRN